MARKAPSLSDVWPFAEAAVPPELADFPVDLFFGDPKGRRVSAARWTTGLDPETAPRAAYALRIVRRGGQGELARWDPQTGNWQPTARFALADGPDASAIVELTSIVLGGVSDEAGLDARLRHLLAAELRDMKVARLASKAVGVLAIITLFVSIRIGVEAQAVEPFALIFAMAAGIGLTAALLRNRCRALGEIALARVREQFQYEFRPGPHDGLSVATVTRALQDLDRKREEEAVIFGFLLLLCFVYFISSLVVIGVIVALVVATLMLGDAVLMRQLTQARDKSEARLQHAALSFRTGADSLAPPALRAAKRSVLRDRVRRYGDVADRMRDAQARQRLMEDLTLGLAFTVVFASYAVPIALGFQTLSISIDDSLVSSSLFSIAPVIVLISISKSTVALARVANQHIVAPRR